MTTRLVEAEGDCGRCLLPLELCECDPERDRLARQHEDMRLRTAADRAIKRGYVVLVKRRTLWMRLRDAWHAFWWGLE